MYKFEQIKSQNAYTARGKIDLFVNDEIVSVENARIFKSYESLCAVYDYETGILYLLPRYDFSPTTIRQLANWIRTYTKTLAQPVKFYREIENGKREDEDYKVAEGYFNQWAELKRY